MILFSILTYVCSQLQEPDSTVVGVVEATLLLRRLKIFESQKSLPVSGRSEEWRIPVTIPRGTSKFIIYGVQRFPLPTSCNYRPLQTTCYATHHPSILGGRKIISHRPLVSRQQDVF